MFLLFGIFATGIISVPPYKVAFIKKKMSMKEWNNFFIDAGIPKNVAAQYASVFHSNRMTFDMLMDLNKVCTGCPYAKCEN